MTEELKERIALAAEALKKAGAREVYIFGSAATGRLSENSDIDMAVSGLPPEGFLRAMGQASRALRRPLDLVDLDAANEFTEYLKKEGELLRVA
ncbi:MAG: nucleotidyltransferase domain-containing protein [Planctomycetota bacterium]|nr:nucleotidyltransferase domain-containing protein [Planctomycetota bacterium]